MGRAGVKHQTFHGYRRLFRRFARKTFGNTDFEQIKGVPSARRTLQGRLNV